MNPMKNFTAISGGLNKLSANILNNGVENALMKVG